MNREAISPQHSGPCANYTVVDLTSLVSGPLAAQYLADLGAEVIKVESKGSDYNRLHPPVHKGLGAGFAQLNRGKKSVEIDVKSEEGLETVLALVKTADVFIENSRPGVMDKLGLGYEALKKINPSIVYVSINGFGDKGRYANRPAYDGVLQAMVGFMPLQGDGDKPQAINSPVVDKITAIWASHATLAALLHRERTGEGQKVNVPMLKAYAAFMLPDNAVDHSFPDADLPRYQAAMQMFRALNTSDGAVLGLILQRRQFEGLVTAIGRSDLLDDPRFQTPPDIVRNGMALYDEIESEVAKISTEDFLNIAEEAGFSFGKVNTVDEFFEDPEIKSIGAFVEFDDPEYGTMRHIGYPADFEKSPASVTRRAPRLGEHSEEILSRVRDTETLEGKAE